METEKNKKDEFVIPPMTEFLKNPILFITVTYDKVNNERTEEAKSLFKEQGELLKEWNDSYLEDISWSRTSSVKYGQRIIESLLKLIDLQVRMVEHSDETVKKVIEIVDKCYIVKESLDLDDTSIKNKEVIIQIDDEEMRRNLEFIQKVKDLIKDPDNNYHEAILKTKILYQLEEKLRDKSLTKTTSKRVLQLAFAYLNNTELEIETKRKTMKLFAHIFTAFYEVYKEYAFLPKNLDSFEKEWGVRLVKV